MKRGTLTRALFARIAPIILAVIAMIGVLAFYSCMHEINSVYDAQLLNNANVLWTLVQQQFDENAPHMPREIGDPDFSPTDAPLLNPDSDDYSDARMFRIWKDGKLTMFSDTALPKEVPSQPEGYSDVVYKGESWRIYSLPIPESTVWIEVGEKLSLRHALVWNILIDLFVPLLVLIPLVAGALWVGIKSGLSVTRSLVAQIQRRSPDDLSAVGMENLPRDLAPLGKSINQLFVKLRHSIDSERRFSDHAAHQLRTPLAGSKLLIQMLTSADSDAERKAITDDLMVSNERASQLVSKLLIAARVSHQPITLHPILLYRATASVLAEMAPLAVQKNHEIELSGNEKVTIQADETLLQLLIGNLVENAIKYTPDGGKITVSITPKDGMVRLAIADTGPGIPEAQRELVFERFYRADEPQAEGAGLGLAIVADIVERFSGSISLKTPVTGTGLRVEILFPVI